MIRKLLLKWRLKRRIRQAKIIIYSGKPNMSELIMNDFIGTHQGLDLIHRYVVVTLVADFYSISVDLLYVEAIREIDSLELDHLHSHEYLESAINLLQAKAELALAKRKWKIILDDNISKKISNMK